MNALDLPLLTYDLVAGLARRGKAMTIAVIDPVADHFPWTDDLHEFRSLRALEQFWWRRFHQGNWDNPAPRLLVALPAHGPTDLQRWWESRGATVTTVQGSSLCFFVRQAEDYGIPPRFHSAHARAQCAATRMRAGPDLNCLAQTLSELNFHLRQTEEAVRRLAAAHDSNSPQRNSPDKDSKSNH